MLADTLRRKSVATEALLQYTNGRLTAENQSLTVLYHQTTRRLESLNLISTSMETATAFVALYVDVQRRKRQTAENLRIEIERKMERRKLTIQRERKGLMTEDYQSRLLHLNSL